MKLFLDDERVPASVAIKMDNGIYMKEPWTRVRNFKEFVDFIKNNEMPELISFDHDLTVEHYKYAFAEEIPYNEILEKTGYHCLLWFLMYCEKNKLTPPKMYFHSQNVTGVRNMVNLLAVYEKVK